MWGWEGARLQFLTVNSGDTPWNELKFDQGDHDKPEPLLLLAWAQQQSEISETPGPPGQAPLPFSHALAVVLLAVEVRRLSLLIPPLLSGELSSMLLPP